MNITEDYVSYEVAKLLKEKGFEGDINAYYHIWDNGNYICSVQEFSNSEAPHLYIPAPTLQMAMKWLREVHKVLIVIDAYHADHWEGYIDSFEISIYHYASTMIVPNEIAYHTDYTEAAEAAIKYSLENLV